MKLLLRILRKWPSERGLILASLVGLLALAVMAMGILHPVPWSVVAGMSVGQGLGVLAFVFFALSVGSDIVRAREATPAPPQEPEKT